MAPFCLQIQIRSGFVDKRIVAAVGGRLSSVSFKILNFYRAIGSGRLRQGFRWCGCYGK